MTIWEIGDRRRIALGSEDVSPTLISKMGTGGGNVPIVIDEDEMEDGSDRTGHVQPERDGGRCDDGGCAECRHAPRSVSAGVRGGIFGISMDEAYGFPIERDVSLTLVNGTCPGHHNGVMTMNDDEIKCFESHSQDARYKDNGDCAPTCHAQMGTGGNNVPLVYGKTGHTSANGCGISEEATHTLGANSGGGMSREGVCVSPTLTASNDPSRSPQSSEVTKQIEAVVFATIDGDKVNKKERKGGSGLDIGGGDVSYTSTAKDVHGVATRGADGLTVRRLLPIETERLMAFPDFWTQIPWKGKPAEECPDAPRYKACGNSMCVNCMEWIGRRIQMEEDRINNEKR